MDDVYCNNCGHRNTAGANFCSSCGAVLESATAEPTTITFFPGPAGEGTDDEPAVEVGEVGEVPAGTGVLVVKRGPNAGSRFALDKPTTTGGRHPESDIFLDDITVSRRHVEIFREGARYTVRDAGSLNGTYVNRERIEEAELHDGDELQVGKFKLFFFQGTTEFDE